MVCVIMNLWSHTCNYMKPYPHMKWHTQVTCIRTIRKKWRHWGMFIHGKTNLTLPPTLCELDYHRHSYLWLSDMSSCPCTWLASIGASSQVVGARKNFAGKNMKKYGTNDGLWCFSPMCTLGYLLVHRCVHHLEIRLSVAFNCSSSPLFCYFGQSALIH